MLLKNQSMCNHFYFFMATLQLILKTMSSNNREEVAQTFSLDPEK